MGLPSKQRTRTSKRQRAAHFALRPMNTGRCDACGAPRLPHRACPSCGTYRGRTVIGVKKRKARRAKRTRRMA